MLGMRRNEEGGAVSQARLHALVTGRVQGVGFRYFVVQRAQQLGLSGFVRNVGFRQVEVEAEGEQEALEQLVEALKRGPSGAYVEHVEIAWAPARGAYQGFTIRPSR